MKSSDALRLTKVVAKVRWIEITVVWDDGDRYFVDTSPLAKAIEFLTALAKAAEK